MQVPNNNLKRVNISAVQNKVNYGKLYNNLTVPSVMNTFSMGVAFMQHWFMREFDDGFFKATNVDESHVMKAYDKSKMLQNLKKMKPSLFISPRLNIEYDRDAIDLNMFGLKQYTRRDNVKMAFFQDKEKNMYLGLAVEEAEISFNFRVRLSSRAQQLDISNRMNKAFRIGTTQEQYLNMDFHIPYSTMMNIAKDAGFEVTDSGVTNMVDFMKYLNSHSAYPILYKYRTLNGQYEFFVRIDNLYAHINTKDRLSLDDGEQEGQLVSNYMIDMQAILHIPTPKVYSYFSVEEHNNYDIETQTESTVGLYSIKMPNIPEKNSKNWYEYLHTTIYDEDMTKPLTVEFEELFKGSKIGDLIKYNNSIMVSSSTFVEVKLFNSGEEIDFTISWKDQVITTKEKVKSYNTEMVVYVDLGYVNEQSIVINKLYDTNV